MRIFCRGARFRIAFRPAARAGCDGKLQKPSIASETYRVIKRERVCVEFPNVQFHAVKAQALSLGAEEVRERPANAAAAECGVHADLLDVIIPACAVVRRGGAHDIFHDRKACDCAAAKRDDHIGIRAVEFFVDMLPQCLGKVRTENIRTSGGMQRKTDDSYANRPFFRFKQDVRETACFGASSFPQCRLFLFFKQRNRTPEAYL